MKTNNRYALSNLLKGRLKANAKLNLSINLLFLLIAAFSLDTTYSVAGIASHIFMFSLGLAISLNGIQYKPATKNLKIKNLLA